MVYWQHLKSTSNLLTLRILSFKLGPCLLLRWFIPAFRSHERPWEFNFYHPNAIRSNQKDRNRLLQHTVSSIDNHNHAATLQYTGGSWLMRIWLMMILLLRNIKRFLRYIFSFCDLSLGKFCHCLIVWLTFSILV